MAYKRRNLIHSLKGKLSEPMTRHEVIPIDTLMERQAEALADTKESKCRLDIAVRYLWVESYLGGKPGYAGLYRRMQ